MILINLFPFNLLSLPEPTLHENILVRHFYNKHNFCKSLQNLCIKELKMKSCEKLPDYATKNWGNIFSLLQLLFRSILESPPYCDPFTRFLSGYARFLSGSCCKSQLSRNSNALLTCTNLLMEAVKIAAFVCSQTCANNANISSSESQDLIRLGTKQD